MRLLHDARDVPQDAVLDCDVCIAGAGAAGIAVARELATSALDVCVLESGGVDPDRRTQELYAGEITGHPYFDLRATRLRFLGGSTNHWTGWCRPLDAIDLAPRPELGREGWPIGLDTLVPYYKRAQAVCGLGAYDYDPQHWAEATGTHLLPDAVEDATTAVFHLAEEVRFGERYREDLQRARNLAVYLHANVVSLVLQPENDRVEAARVRVLDGPSFAVRARCFVLALGGIENARMLLASDDVRTAGIGNQGGLVGRYFGDHPHVRVGQLLPSWNLPVPTLYDGWRQVGGSTVRGVWTLAPEVLRSERLGHVSLSTIAPPHHPEDDSAADAGTAALLAAVEATGAHEPFHLLARSEQQPDRDSRVLLARDHDELGLRRVQLDWRVGDLDRWSIRRTVERFASALGAAGLGRVRMGLPGDPDDWPMLEGGNHHLGTTRMHPDPARGVVDADSRVHGTANLYVAGSSIFPSYGYANPTLTLVALALRLADHLREVLP